ncbi:MAG: GntR family transcriptional regulator [Actinobacteria bacterium]|nr:GntR family transcriptional regulator [Actinomycetota bacterium]
MPPRTGYAEIAAHFRRRIEDGELKPGDRMPTMQQVREQFGVTIATANRAYKQLQTEGLTSARIGSGTVVAARPRIASTGAARVDRLLRTGNAYAPGETSTDHVVMVRSCADPDIATELDIELHNEIVIRRRVFRRDGRPTIVALSCINPRALIAVPELLHEGNLRPFWHTTYQERTGQEITRSPERRSARLASDDELAALEIDVPPSAAVPVLVLHTSWHDEEGPIEVWEDVYAPGLWQVSSE